MPQRTPRHSISGFTVLELAIVLTIIGLIIGGIFVGRSLIRSAEILTVIGEIDSYAKAAQLFRDKYHELPGDMPDAESFWGSEIGGCPVTPYTAYPHTTTCNGNGDGRIGTMNAADYYEWFRAWQHLSNAGFITGTFNGIAGTGSAMQAIVGTNIPPATVTPGGYTLFYFGIIDTALDANYFEAEYNHVIMLGAATPTSWNINPTLMTSEALQLDQKIDDGLPASGKIVSFKSPILANCLTSDVASTAVYNIAYTANRACSLMIITGF